MTEEPRLIGTVWFVVEVPPAPKPPFHKPLPSIYKKHLLGSGFDTVHCSSDLYLVATFKSVIPLTCTIFPRDEEKLLLAHIYVVPFSYSTFLAQVSQGVSDGVTERKGEAQGGGRTFEVDTIILACSRGNRPRGVGLDSFYDNLTQAGGL